jgi:uncharacterized UPF0146 family protein
MIFAEEEIRNMLTDGERDLFSFYNSGDIVSKYEKREKYRTGVSWHVPTQELISLISKYGPIVSVGSGFAYTESIAISQGVDLIATDIEPSKNNKWCRDGKFHCEVEKLTASEAVKKYKGRNVFMGWPPYANPMAYEVASSMKVGAYLIYVGEGWGGCTGDDEFFQTLESDFVEVDSLRIPRWSGINDYCTVYRKTSLK